MPSMGVQRGSVHHDIKCATVATQAQVSSRRMFDGDLLTDVPHCSRA